MKTKNKMKKGMNYKTCQRCKHRELTYLSTDKYICFKNCNNRPLTDEELEK